MLGEPSDHNSAIASKCFNNDPDVGCAVELTYRYTHLPEGSEKFPRHQMVPWKYGNEPEI